jgi:Integrase core domain
VPAADGEELRRELFDYVEIFNNETRRHSTLGMLSPARYEEEMISLKQLNKDNYNPPPVRASVATQTSGRRFAGPRRVCVCAC